MTREQFMELLRAMNSAMSEYHGDHEGGYAGNCAKCAILGLLEAIELLATEAEWEEVPEEKPRTRSNGSLVVSVGKW